MGKEQTNKETLLRCPICGSIPMVTTQVETDSDIETGFVYCSGCGFKTEQLSEKKGATKDNHLLVELWNTYVKAFEHNKRFWQKKYVVKVKYGERVYYFGLADGFVLVSNVGRAYKFGSREDAEEAVKEFGVCEGETRTVEEVYSG